MGKFKNTTATNLPAVKSSSKTGQENLSVHGSKLDFNLLNFWQWSVSDLLSNATRGRFAEFIVATALELDLNNLREEWDAFDLVTKEGVKIEVKSAAYIQSWAQKDFSSIKFDIRPTRNIETSVQNAKDEVKRQADLYVFCLLKHKDQSTIDPLRMEQWEFYVLPTKKLNEFSKNQQSVGLNTLRKLVTAVQYLELKNEVSFCL